MKYASRAASVAAALSLAAPLVAQTRTAVGPYTAVTDRVAYPEPALPALGAAGSTFTDPVFKSTIHRVTDAMTRPGSPNRSYRTPSSPHQNAWSVKSSYFYVMGSGGSGPIPFAFDPANGIARRIQPTAGGEGGLVLKFYIEPQFSYVDDAVIYGSYNGVGSSKRTIDQYDFSTGVYTRLLDLDTVMGGLSGTYIGSVASSGGPTERIMAFFGGSSQDRHRYVVVFDKANPQNRQIIDTIASTLNGAPAPITLNFHLHHAMIDRGGRFVMLYTTSADQAAPRKAAQEYLWDLQTGQVTELGVSALPYGHDAFGYGVYVNKDCCTSTTWDAGQWQYRELASPLTTRDLITKVQTPKETYLSDHTTWNNARPDRLMPVVSSLYRFGTNTTAWRAWDDEIVAIQTDAPGANATVWRFAHHRSDVSYDGDPSRTAFWYQPLPNVSQDGRFVLFSSNWEKTLGIDPTGEAGTAARQDVFLLELAGSGAPLPEVTQPVMWLDAPGGAATLAQPFTIAGWAIDAGSGRDSGIDAINVWAYPNPGSNQPPVFLGAPTYGRARGDIAAMFGTQFTASGFDLTVSGLPAGTYTLAVFAHSRITGTFNNLRVATVTVTALSPRMSIDVPANGTTTPTTFTVAGWAIDPNATSGSGVDAIHVWAAPNPGSGEAPRFVGVATLGLARPDVQAAFGPTGAASGYTLTDTLPPGVYDLLVFAHSSVTGTFNNAQSIRVTIR
jgi:hypothetical protein